MTLNPDKSDAILLSTAILLGTCQRSRTFASVRSVDVAGCSVSLFDNIKILRVTLDYHLSLDKHISSICKSAYYHIQSLRHIRSAITDDMTKSVASSLVCTRLDYANSLLFNTTQKNINRLEFKLATSMYNILNSSQPAYLCSLLNYHTTTSSLRSANTSLLSVPCVRTTFASRGFSIAASTVWNSLPSSIRSSTSADTFRRLLETHCLQKAYCSP